MYKPIKLAFLGFLSSLSQFSGAQPTADTAVFMDLNTRFSNNDSKLKLTLKAVDEPTLNLMASPDSKKKCKKFVKPCPPITNPGTGSEKWSILLAQSDNRSFIQIMGPAHSELSIKNENNQISLEKAVKTETPESTVWQIPIHSESDLHPLLLGVEPQGVKPEEGCYIFVECPN